MLDGRLGITPPSTSSSENAILQPLARAASVTPVCEQAERDRSHQEDLVATPFDIDALSQSEQQGLPHLVILARDVLVHLQGLESAGKGTLAQA